LEPGGGKEGTFWNLAFICLAGFLFRKKKKGKGESGKGLPRDTNCRPSNRGGAFGGGGESFADARAFGEKKRKKMREGMLPRFREKKGVAAGRR